MASDHEEVISSTSSQSSSSSSEEEDIGHGVLLVVQNPEPLLHNEVAIITVPNPPSDDTGGDIDGDSDANCLSSHIIIMAPDHEEVINSTSSQSSSSSSEQEDLAIDLLLVAQEPEPLPLKDYEVAIITVPNPPSDDTDGDIDGDSDDGPPPCGGCGFAITDGFITSVLEKFWHAKCLCCSVCNIQLKDNCYSRSGLLFCKEDFSKRYSMKCAGCKVDIPSTEVARRAQDNVYHFECFACFICDKQLSTGDKFYVKDDKTLVCKCCIEATKDEVDGQRRSSVTISATQLKKLKAVYNNNPTPTRDVREQLSQDTGLDMHVVQVWFQNRRAKDRRQQEVNPQEEDLASAVEPSSRD